MVNWDTEKSLQKTNTGKSGKVISLRETRKIQNLTQKRLSQISGVDQGDISKLENGSKNPSIKMLMKLAKGLNMRVSIRLIHPEGLYETEIDLNDEWL